MPVRPVIQLSTYDLEALRKDADFILYRGRREDDGSRVLLVAPVEEHPRPENLKLLEHAHTFKEELDAAWAARPIAMARYWDRPVLVMEDPGGVPLDQLLGRPLDIELSLRLGISLSNAIDQLHRRDIIHKDIKPAHILANFDTGQCWLRGFGIASRLPRERQAPEPPEFVEGTLAYMAPEQTGRMNRSIDSRSDLYSLGVTLYEMLTGSLPFTASDPMEWVHCHIARQPVPPSDRVANLPAQISAVVLKLLAKTAEERYQTAAGVKSDLQRCLDEWERGSATRRSIRTRRNTPTLHHSITPAAEIDDSLSDEAQALQCRPLKSASQARRAPEEGRRRSRENEIADEISEFPLAEHDTSDRLLIPQKLYGRGREVETLLASFERVVTTGRQELILVSGYSGIGKSAVVNELHKAIVQPRGIFISGKFEQHKGEIPYATLAHAFQGLIREILGKSEAELGRWRTAILNAVEPNGQLMVNVIPELELIIGEQPPLPEVPVTEAESRFHKVFRSFLAVFAREDHPLALFLDDLQWIDAATLKLLEDFTVHPGIEHLLLVGAYRDNEVSDPHPLMQALDAIRQTGAIVHDIVVGPLTLEDVTEFVADTLHCGLAPAEPLAAAIHQKTQGNPFFVIQFITSLHEEHLLTFDREKGGWKWDPDRIQARRFADNVVDLMVNKLEQLPVGTRETLTRLACLGSMAGIPLLALVQGRSEEEVQTDLWEAVRRELIVRLEEGSYKFAHDRAWEASYSLIPEELRAEAHLRIARLLTENTAPEKLEESIFQILNQINRGAALLNHGVSTLGYLRFSRAEREQVAQLYLIAGKRAKTSTAYASALKYLSTAADLLENDCWERKRELIFDLEFHRAECEFLTGQSTAADQRLTMLSSRAANPAELATVTCLRVDLYTTLDRTDRVVAVCLDYLRNVGIEWPAHPTEEEARREYERIWIKIGNRSIEELVGLPLMSDPTSLGTLDVLTRFLGPVAYTDPNLVSLTACRAINLSLEQGNGDGSCVAYVWLGRIAGPHFGDYKAGFRFGQLGYELAGKHGLERFKAPTYLWFAQFVAPWMKHVRTSRELMRGAFEAASKAGDINTQSYCFDNLNTNFLAAGDPLAEAQRQAESALKFVERTGYGFGIDIVSGQLGLIRTLRGVTGKFGCFDDEQISETQLERHFTAEPAATQPACWYWIRKLQAQFFAGDYQAALDAAAKAQPLLWVSPATFEIAEYHFYAALARAAVCDSATPDSRFEHSTALAEHHRQLALWAGNCPENFENRAALVSAEIARIEERELAAERLYEKAIRSSHTNGFVHNEAIASELTARFYAARGFDTIAEAYLRKARYCYLRWGAAGKVRQLDELHPQLTEEEPVSGLTSTIGTPVEQLDLATVMKVSHAVSEEIVLEQLIKTLMVIAIEHAGAQRGLLILPFGEEYRIVAEAKTGADQVEVHAQQATVAPSDLPDSLLRYVLRTQESVILDDASSQPQSGQLGRHGPAVAGGSKAESPETLFTEDEYVRHRRPKSILCLPLVKQAKLVGLLYLENNLASGVFTPRRLEMLELLASQAAISLDHARLYADLIQENNDRRKAEEALRASEERWSTLAGNSSAGIALIDSNGRFLAANEALQIMLGYSEDELRQRRVSDITYEDDRAATETRIEDARAGRQRVHRIEKRYLHKDGTMLWVEVNSVFVPAGANNTAFFSVVIIDITKRKRAEEKLGEAQNQLAHVSRVNMMGELAASIAHEVNQPLAGMLTNANASMRWLAGESPNLAEARDAIQRIVRDGSRASDVMARMRALFKKAPSTKERVVINLIIQEVLALAQPELRRNRVFLKTQLADDLPIVIGDKIQLQQVILNLVMNAIEAMTGSFEGSRDLQVSSQKINEVRPEPGKEPVASSDLHEREQSFVLIAVRDSGPGLDPKQLQRVFETFYTTKSSGMGMGLAISRSIIEAHHGRLWVGANTAKGAIFQFTLPAAGLETRDQ
jgi:PAS domain S-box-containing protein